MSQGWDNKNYSIIKLVRGGARKTLKVHRIVLNAFVGARPTGMLCRHLDGNKRNNNLSNLCWGTYNENAEDQFKHGTAATGERHGNSKLDDSDVLEIRRDYVRIYRNRTNASELAARYGVSVSAIQNVVSGKRGTSRGARLNELETQATKEAE